MNETQIFTSLNSVFIETLGNQSQSSYFASLLFISYFNEFGLEQDSAVFTANVNDNSGIVTIEYESPSVGQGILTIEGQEQDNSVFFDAEFEFVGIDSSRTNGNLNIEGKERENAVSFDASYELNEDGESEEGSLNFTAEINDSELFFQATLNGSDEEGSEETRLDFRGTIDNNVANGIITSETFTNGISQGEETEAYSVQVPEEIDSTEETALQLTGGTAQIAYVAYYGRPADRGGRDFWNEVLTDNEVSYAPRKGDTLTGSEQNVYDRIVNDFGNSAEADRLFGAIEGNRNKVNRVYQFAFNRNGDPEGLDFWTEQINNGSVTLATFALEVALGAQNNDITVLNHKIDSADLFSDSIDTQAKIDAYSGSEGELFGRDWLSDFGDRVSSIAEVNEAFMNLIA